MVMNDAMSRHRWSSAPGLKGWYALSGDDGMRDEEGNVTNDIDDQRCAAVNRECAW